MSIDELDLVPESPAAADVAEEGLMHCQETLTCYYVASIYTIW